MMSVGQLRLRWIGHQLHGEGDLVVPAGLSLVRAHEVAVAAEQHLRAVIPRVTRATLHPDPAPLAGRSHH
jgi:divalent metal cation (Fe/Co/Zn/Cd) transporter